MIIVSVTRRRKFNIVNNDNGRTHKCDFSVCHRKFPFLGKFCQKNQNWQFKLKFGTQTNSNMQNSMALFIFSVLDRKHPFWANLAQKIEVVSLSWNLIPRLIRISRIQWRSSLFLFETENTLLGQLWSKKLKLSV